MKTLLKLLLIICCVSWSYANSPFNTFTGSVTLTSQQEVNDFGANGYTIITGHLAITTNGTTTTDITDLMPLSTLTSIGGTPTTTDGSYLEISNNDNLVTLNGLDNLTNVTSSVIIKNNSVLNSLQGLSGITSSLGGIISHGLFIENNSSLVNLDGLNFESVYGTIEIKNNPILQSISSFGNFNLSGKIYIENNPVLTSIPNFNIPGSSMNTVSIVNNDAITSLPVVNKLISSLLNIDGNDGITNLNGFEDAPLGTILPIGNLYISNNINLTTLNGLNTDLTNLGNIVIENNAQLTDIDWLTNCTQFALEIKNNDALTSLSALTNFSDGFLVIDGNSGLTNLNGLENFTNAFQLTILNTNLSSLTALSNLALIENKLHLENNPNLTSLDGFNGVTAIGNNSTITDFKIINLDGLISLDGFDNLTEIKADLTISGNDNLEDFCALSTAINNGLTESYSVSNNASNPTVADFNVGNCSTLSIKEFETYNISFYPNPIIENLRIQDTNNRIKSIKVYSADGREISVSIQNNSVSFEKLNAGMYLVKVKTITDNQKTFKVIKR